MTVKNRYARGRGWAADTSAPQSVSHPRCSPASKLPLLGPCVSLFRIQRVAGSLPFFQSSKKVIWQFLLVFWDFCGKMCVCSCQHCHVAGLYLNLFWRQSLQRENSPAPRDPLPIPAVYCTCEGTPACAPGGGDRMPVGVTGAFSDCFCDICHTAS